MDCPRCGFKEADGPSCPACGVIFAKLREAPRPRSTPEATQEERASAWASNRIWSVILAGVLCVAAVGWVRVRNPRPSSALARRVTPPPPPVDDAAELPAPAAAVPTLEAPIAAPNVETKGLSEEEARIIDRLVSAVNNRQPVVLADVDLAIGLQARYSGERELQRLVTEMLLLGAQQEVSRGRIDDAITLLRRAAGTPWADNRVRSALLAVLMTTSDWSAVESYASGLLRLDARNVDAWYALGYSYFRRDRNREAIDALRNGLSVYEDGRARALLTRLEKNKADEDGMREQQLAHFHVRYDGDEHEDIGREVLRALERHYATLASALDHQPQEPIPVILFSRQAYYDASGAPAWAGGSYDQMDGRIRIPIGGLDRNLAPEMDKTLIHELTHAFVHDKSRGVAPREIHEGLAQFMEGHRVDTRLDTRMRNALAQGRLGGVGGFYINALALVEYLISTRGQGGMNDLLKAMGETGDVETAFRQVHGQGYQAVQAAWRHRMQQQHGS